MSCVTITVKESEHKPSPSLPLLILIPAMLATLYMVSKKQEVRSSEVLRVCKR